MPIVSLLLFSFLFFSYLLQRIRVRFDGVDRAALMNSGQEFVSLPFDMILEALGGLMLALQVILAFLSDPTTSCLCACLCACG